MARPYRLCDAWSGWGSELENIIAVKNIIGIAYRIYVSAVDGIILWHKDNIGDFP